MAFRAEGEMNSLAAQRKHTPVSCSSDELLQATGRYVTSKPQISVNVTRPQVL